MGQRPTKLDEERAPQWDMRLSPRFPSAQQTRLSPHVPTGRMGLR